MIWIDLLVTAVSAQAPALVATGLDADTVMVEHGPGIELAEVLAGAASALEDWLPGTDRELAAVVARDGEPSSDLGARGLLLVRPDGGLGFTIGRGQVVESVGESLAIIQAPGAGRYVRGYRLPGYKYWGQ
ncbi:hypothetical protein ACSYDW_07040 [Paeniglutamicibacter sp. R2-26]|uniref:hypothetical protein n=1 Tax=Paeniglutamicibacter sp. R2-26 TaxID=3144417 RepID=UPI003EE7DE62